MTRKERERQTRENEILDVAESLLFSKGFERTSLVEIAQKAEFSRPTLYKYFHSKEEIYVAVHIRGLKIRWQMAQEAMKKEGIAAEKLYAYGTAYYEFALKYPEYLRLQLYWDVNGLDKGKIRPEHFAEFEEINEQARTEMKEVIHELCRSTTSHEGVDPDWILGYLFHTLRIILNQALFSVDPFGRYNDPEYYFQYLRFFIRALTASNLSHKA
jgi:AcrR family transcriptional regulator